MQLNADINQRGLARFDAYDWITRRRPQEQRDMPNLHEKRRDDVALQRAATGPTQSLDISRHIEVLMIAGSLADEGDTRPALHWCRVPVDSKVAARAGDNAATVWVTTRPFRHIPDN